MDSLDLIELISMYKVLKDVKVHGIIKRELKKPENIHSTVNIPNNGVFVEMDVFAVDLSNYNDDLEKRGIVSPLHTYRVNGSICSFVRRTNLIVPDWYTLSGDIRFGSRSTRTYVSLLHYKQSVSRSWSLEYTPSKDVTVADWTSHNKLYTQVYECALAGDIVRTEELKRLPKFYAEDRMIVLGGDSDTQASTGLLQAVGSTPVTDSNISHVEEVSRLTILTKSKNYNELFKLNGSTVDKMTTYIKGLKSKYPFKPECNKYVLDLFDRINASFKSKPSAKALTGQFLIKAYLNTFPELAEKDFIGMPALDYVLDSFSDVVRYINTGDSSFFMGSALELVTSAFSEFERAYANIVALLTNESMSVFEAIWEVCDKNSISFSNLINNDPYALQLIHGLNFNDTAKIATCFGKRSADEISDKSRALALINAYLYDTSRGSTVFDYATLLRADIGETLTKVKYEKCRYGGTYLTDTQIANSVYYLGVSRENLNLSLAQFTQVGYDNWINRLGTLGVRNALDVYESSGFGVKYKNLFIPSRLLNKELYVYNKLYEMGNSPTDIDQKKIDFYIGKYEKEMGFMLERDQRYGVYLLLRKSGVVAGCAGSGKTTVSSCFLYVLSNIEPNTTIKFAAPTGKAAKRMSEVVKVPVKTMASMFMTFDSSNNLFDVGKGGSLGDKEVFLFDEVGMVTIDILYSILRKVDNCRIYFFGDFKQLPPIGKGLPFKDLLRFMPCVFLRVSKRAASGSNITLNSDYINNYSEDSNLKPLVSDRDFLLFPCGDDKIRDNVVMLCRYFLGKASELELEYLLESLKISKLPVIPDLDKDDIQVVTPVQQAKYSWGSIKINERLKPLFNTNRNFNDSFSTGKSGVVFTIGDRVIHTRNMYTLQWYSSVVGGSLQKTYGFGVNNGDVGKIYAIYEAKNCVVLDEKGKAPADFDYPESIRKDKSYTGDNAYFVVVEYFDHMSDSKYYILYRARTGFGDNTNVGLSLVGEDLTVLSLFYAGTTHKLQGSQARVLIACLGNLNFTGFLNRNMIYTEITRGIDLVIFVGAVSNNRDSQLSKSRLVVAEDNIFTVGELLHGKK